MFLVGVRLWKRPVEAFPGIHLPATKLLVLHQCGGTIHPLTDANVSSWLVSLKRETPSAYFNRSYAYGENGIRHS